MARRNAAKQDSLELLLDTICNTFGGVLFIAILVVMLLQQTDSRVVSSPKAEVAPGELIKLGKHLSEVSDELIRLKANRESQAIIVDKFSTDEVRDLIHRQRDLAKSEAELQQKVNTLLAQNVLIAASIETSRENNAKVRENLASALFQKQQAETALEENRKRRTAEARLPLLRSSERKAEIGVVLQFGRIYLWHQYDRFQNRDGLNTVDFVVVGEESGGIVTRPKPTGGIVLDESAGSKDAVRRLLRRFDPKTCYFVAIVRPDSFSMFSQFRDVALELGFNYRLMPVELNSAILDRGGNAAGVQ